MHRSGIRHALFGTLPGRAIVIGVAIRLAVYLAGLVTGGAPLILGVIDTVASIGLAIGAACFAWKLVVFGKRHLLWRVRRKLILSYVFIGFIPAALIVSFFLLSGFLLFYNFSSYLVQSRLRAIGEQAKFLAQSTAIEIQRGGGRDAAAIIARRQGNADDEYPGLSVAVVPVDRPCAAGSARTSSPPPGAIVSGPWAHVAPPATLPGWVGCEGFTGLLAYSHDDIAVRAAVFSDAKRPTFAVIYDVPVGTVVKERLRRETGVGITTVGVLREAESEARSLSGGLLSNLVSLVEYRDWDSGTSGVLFVTTELRIGVLYDRISSGPGLVSRRFGQGLLLALFIIGGLFVIIEAMALFIGLALAKSITGSVHELFAGTERVRHGDFTHKIAVTAQDQLGELAQSFNSMTASIENLLLEAAEKKRMEEELRIARDIQMSLLPQGPLMMPGVSVAAACIPAREIGGDYYDFFRLDEHRVGVLIADVSGKGTSAALYMAELKGLVLSLSQIHASPRALLMSANRIIADNLGARSFITMTYAVVDVRQKTMTWARAGHTPLMLVPGAGSRKAQVLVPDGMVVGLKLDNGEMFDRLLVEQTIPLGAGDLYLFFTDGISEAMNATGDCFGDGRLGSILEEHADLPPEELRERILRDVASFAGDTPQHDDMTMILLKIDPLHA